MRMIVDGKPTAVHEGDNLLVAMLRADCHPTGGGTLCMGGDCMHCLATVDGVSYVRTCQTQAKPGMVVERHHFGGEDPPLPTNETHREETAVRNLHCDVVVIGGGESGQAAAAEAEAAGKKTILLDANAGQEAVGIYSGPLVVAKTEAGMLQLHVKDEVVVATGAAEIQPVTPDDGLAGLVTARAAEQLAATDLDLGRVVAVGTPPRGVDAVQAEGELVRLEGDGGKITAVVTQLPDGSEKSYPCDTATFGLGFHPRNALYRMCFGALGNQDLPVRIVGDAARESDIPPCPKAGTVCACSGVTVSDLERIWDQGFHEMELVKRATLAGTGTCQGSACIPYLRSFLQEKGEELQAPFTARPVSRQLTMGEIAAGGHHHPTAQTALHDEHVALGAQMERSGGWWRPWDYGHPEEEYWAVREAVSIMDVSTLGKMIISGPDALELLEKLYPTKVRTIREGRSRYVLMLNERGYVFDDGMICKDSDTQYTLTFTSGGSSHAEMWVRDWVESWGLDVRILLQTHRLGAINVTGPLANKLLERAGLTDPPKYLRHVRTQVAGIDCHVFRLSFTGELSYELHHPAEDSVKLWRTLLELGQDLGIKPHGLDTLLRLRLEKGHIIVGQDTDFDSTPRRIHHEWAVKLDKEFFIGRQAVIRTDKEPLDKLLVGLEITGEPEGYAPIEGAIVWYEGSKVYNDYAGIVTSSSYSPVLGKAVMLAWLYLQDGVLPDEVVIEGKTAVRVPLPFYDKEASRARA